MLDFDLLSLSYILFSYHIIIYIYDYLGFKKKVSRIYDENPVFYVYLLFLYFSTIHYKEFDNVPAFWIVSSLVWIVIIFLDFLKYTDEHKTKTNF